MQPSLQTDAQIAENTSNAPNVNTLKFDDLNLARPILSALKSAGYITPTPIQAQAIPAAMSGRDLLLSAQTGSGKTAAFVLPILHKLSNSVSTDRHANKPVMAVILTPTRELAMQVQDNVRKYSSAMRGVFSTSLVGGTSYVGQIRALKKGVQIIIATPGRFIDHLQSERIDLSALQMLVLDEADRMLDMGFSDDINTILSAMPKGRQTIMSSATWDGAVGKIAESYTNNPIKIAIQVESAHIEESVYFCDDFQHKNAILSQILQNPDISQAVIFAATKRSTEELAERLNDSGIKAHYLHGDLPQGKRNRIVSDIKSKKAKLLIATDVAARGIDIAGISHVINYDLPRQAEDYVHRIGRSGRAGRTGVALNLCSIDDKNLLFAINRYLDRTMKVESFEGLEPIKNTGMARITKERKSNNRRPKSSGRFGVRDERKALGEGSRRAPKAKSFGFSSEFADKKPVRADGQIRRAVSTRFDERYERYDGEHKRSRFDNHQQEPRFDDRSDDNQTSRSAKPAFKKGNFKGTKDGFKADGFKKDGFKKDSRPKRQFADGGFKAGKKSNAGKSVGSKGAQEIVFHQTASKKRFGNKD